MVRATQASSVVLPETSSAVATVFEFLVQKFPQIDASVWRRRIIDNKVYWHGGEWVTLDSEYRPKQRVYYYREVPQERKIPLEEAVLYQDERIIIAYKPAFLALSPSGQVVNECLVNRLRIKCENEHIVPAHRLDRATAGLVLLVKQPQYRDAYHSLFRDGHISKTYQALAYLTDELKQQYPQGILQAPRCWTVKNRIEAASPSFTRQLVAGEANSHSEIALVEVMGDIGRFQLSPITGRTHQLRLHMHSLGMAIINDRCYPCLQPKAVDDYASPLMLLAQRLQFSDPICGRQIDIALADIQLADSGTR
ncbi:pseudouridine synthase [Shewanella sp. Isolate11]|uniref:pseudouridine synthase n=1 Tax=Shewanella sp. Isolate11 TaxID=2908530 RepID=UPI001EFDD80B|nr:pseudouridine synthase [Shewanella sp. Isolate11]MCG9698209.1 pseudouridine synthase [Shewanella sp. Isolate11]